MADRETAKQSFEGINVKLEYIQRDLHDLKTLQQQNFVTKDEFEPIKKVVYGLVGLILVAVVGALVALVVK